MKDYCDIIKKYTTIEPQNVLEIGTRDGDDAHFMAQYFNIPDNKVYLVEPNPIQCEKIKDKYPYYNLYEGGVTLHNSPEGAIFYQVMGNDGVVGTSSFMKRTDGWYERFKTNKILVPTITGRDLLNRILDKEIDLCKIDVEGLTYEVLVSFSSFINQIKSFHIECELKQYWEDQHLYDSVRKYMEQHGYFEIYKHPVFDAQLDVIFIKREYLNYEGE